MVQNMNKKSVFVAYQQHDLASDESGSEDIKHKRNTRKKKSRSKKKNNDGALLKDLAMCTISSKRSKNKAKNMMLENAGNGETIVQSTTASAAEQVQKCPVESPTKQQVEQDSKCEEMGAVYFPTHITVTRKDGQKSRTISVAEMMNQLFFFREQNTQLIRIQEQFSVANSGLQQQLAQDSEIISSLQNEVAMFRQMCLNLQTEVSQLRLSTRSQSHRSINTATCSAPPGIERR